MFAVCDRRAGYLSCSGIERDGNVVTACVSSVAPAAQADCDHLPFPLAPLQ